MENWSVWKIIKVGFWLGIGFIIPQLIVMYSGTALTVFAMPAIFEMAADEYIYELDEMESEGDSYPDASGFFDDYDLTGHVKLGEYSEKLVDGHLHIIGSVTNTGDKPAGSIQIEAELMDAQGMFIYECTEYIGQKVQPGERENFLMKCGCNREKVPDYDSISLRVTQANAF